MELIAGRRYRTRDGEITSPLAMDKKPIANQEFTGTVGGTIRNWDHKGRWAAPYSMGLDLIEEIEG
jgi:hypothetical protein